MGQGRSSGQDQGRVIALVCWSTLAISFHSRIGEHRRCSSTGSSLLIRFTAMKMVPHGPSSTVRDFVPLADYSGAVVTQRANLQSPASRSGAQPFSPRTTESVLIVRSAAGLS